MFPNWNDYQIDVNFNSNGDACTYAFDRYDRHNMEAIEDDLDNGLLEGSLIDYYQPVYLGPYETMA